MWQITWMLGLLPEWIWHTITIGGAVALVVAMVLSRIPFVSQYNLLIKLVGITALLLGVWMEGGIANEAKWQAKVADMEAKLEEAKKESAKVNTVVETKVVTKTKVIKEKADTIIQYVDREKEIVKFDTTCPIPKEAIDVHNEAARMNQAIEELRKGSKK
jgi:hypothetical protein